MSKITKSTLQFLKDLNQNNNREWFMDHKKSFEAARDEFEQFIDGTIQKIAIFDPSIAHHNAKSCVFRIYRDVRFSKDKSPYKTHFGAHITSAATRSEIHSRAGYYIHVEPGGSMLAGGAYLPQGDWLKAIRQEIHYNAEAFKKILNQKDFTTFFGEIEGEKLKKAPKGFEPDHPEIELLKYKSFLATHLCKDEQVIASDFQDHCSSVFKALFPFDQFLNSALE